jgi:hypothetical protein
MRTLTAVRVKRVRFAWWRGFFVLADLRINRQ